jgi:toxin CcdB
LRQFDVFRNPSSRSRAGIPFVIALQSHLLNSMPTVIIAPLLVDDSRSAYSYTSARILFDGQRYILSAAEMVAIDATTLGRSIGNLVDHEDAIRRAMERVFTGF